MMIRQRKEALIRLEFFKGMNRSRGSGRLVHRLGSAGSRSAEAHELTRSLLTTRIPWRQSSLISNR